MLVCFFHCTRGCGRIARLALPAPSDLGERDIAGKNSDASRREIAESHVNLRPRHCEEQSDEAIILRHSGMVRQHRPQMRNCASGNLEIPGSMLRIAPE